MIDTLVIKRKGAHINDTASGSVDATSRVLEVGHSSEADRISATFTTPVNLTAECAMGGITRKYVCAQLNGTPHRPNAQPTYTTSRKPTYRHSV